MPLVNWALLERLVDDPCKNEFIVDKLIAAGAKVNMTFMEVRSYL